MKSLLLLMCWSLLLVRVGYAQQSTNVIDYQVTYDATTTRYTAWVIPRYNVPNSNNTGTVERGGTAQFTIKVPSSFSVVDIQDTRGVWDKEPLRLGPGNPNQNWTGTGIDPAINYYVIGKAPGETDYGPFTSGTPVALFTFRGTGCFGPISPLEPSNLFISQADQRLSLNVANSFYSRSAQPSGGNQNPLEQFRTVTGVPALCDGIIANADSQTLTSGTSTTISVLTNDTRNGQPISNTSVTVTVISPPGSGTATVNPNGTISYIPPANLTGPVQLTYTICDIIQPTLCSSAAIMLTIQPITGQAADLLITKRVSQPISATGDIVSFTVTVVNRGPGGAVGVTVTDTIARNAAVQIQGVPIVSKGSFNTLTSVWTIGDMADNETITLVMTVKIVAEGVLINAASVTATGSQDPAPANNQATACTSVPIILCSGEILSVSVANTFQDVRWYLNGGVTPVATGNTITIGQAGTYTVSSMNNACPLAGCCPLIVQPGACCPPVACIPFTVRKTKSRL